MSTATHQPMPDPIPTAPKRGRRKAVEAVEAKPETEKPKRGRPRKNAAETLVEAAVEAVVSGDPGTAETLVEAAVVAAGTETVAEAVEGAAEAEVVHAAAKASAPVVATYDPREPEAVVMVAPGSTPYVDPYARDIREWRKKLRAKSSEVKEHRAKVEEIKLELKDAKKVLEADLIEFERLVDADPEKSPLPLFDKPKPAEPMAAASPKPQTAENPEAWRETSIDALDLNEPTKDKLRSAGIETMGKLADFVAPNKAGYCKRFSDIDGIGAATAEKIEEATMKFWETRPASPPAAPPIVATEVTAAEPLDEEDEDDLFGQADEEVDPESDDDFEIDDEDDDDDEDE